MQVCLNLNPNNYISMGISKKEKANQRRKEKKLSQYLQALSSSKSATIPPLTLASGINPNKGNVFDTFEKIDDVTRQIGFIQSKESWNNCLLSEMEEFIVARTEYENNKTQQNFDHMEEEMGDIFFTAASIAKDSGINAEEAFRSTNRKIYNRLNIMERLMQTKPQSQQKNLADCRDYERRALWNAAKRKIVDAQSKLYQVNT